MKFDEKNPPRTFPVGNARKFDMKDCGTLRLDADEQITLTTESGGEYDVARKDWGFYATPSLNGRLPSFGLRGVLIKNRGTGRYFVFLVERGRDAEFEDYLRVENLAVIAWLDSDEALKKLEAAVST
ncbi:MAG: hypothetical protein K1X78_02110 [Verrucomicrobiaceae bacterium]|nr:hypothetical protein [Verrucomicrobiaceae bacterium]